MQKIGQRTRLLHQHRGGIRRVRIGSNEPFLEFHELAEPLVNKTNLDLIGLVVAPDAARYMAVCERSGTGKEEHTKSFECT